MATSRHSIVSRQPAIRWQDGFPSGNGCIGALVYGSIAEERILFNHEHLWLRIPKPELPDVSAHLPELRRLLEQGRYQDAQLFLSKRLEEAGYPHRRPAPYHPAFDLALRMPTREAFRRYRRSLDFETGEVRVEWEDGGCAFQRDLFVSRADDVVVYRIRGERHFSGSVALVPHESTPSAPPSVTFHSSAEDGWLTFVGTHAERDLYPEGNQFGGIARVDISGGTASVTGNVITFTDAAEVLFRVGLFANEMAEAAIPEARSRIAALPESYEALKQRHVELHRPLFLRTDITLDTAPDERSTEELLLDAYDGTVPVRLIETMFDFGRYLLISSSRPGGLPANLQGIWNGEWNPPWQSDFHNDENIQMNYWEALPGSLPETLEPFFSYFESMVPDYRENARKVYGCRGILLPICQTTDGMLYTDVWTNWTAGAGWIAQHFFDYWLFTGDKEFLLRRAIPFMKEVALFYEDFLFEGTDGRLVFSPSLSPENIPDRPGASHAQINATMDVAVARELLTNLCSACELMDVECEGIARWRKLLEKLPAYETNKDGAIREWIHPDLPDNYHHRHLSHIYPLFPGLEVTRETEPELFEACRLAVEKRLVIGLSSQSGWSYAHMANIYARLGNGDRALDCLENLCRSVVGPNLFTYHNDWRQQGLTVGWFGSQPPFQIDANLGISAAVLEMLVFSVPGMIKVLPALPDSWRSGSASRIACRGGGLVSIQWDLDAGVVDVHFQSKTDRPIVFQFPFRVTDLEVSGASQVSESPLGAHYREVTPVAGADVRMRAVTASGS